LRVQKTISPENCRPWEILAMAYRVYGHVLSSLAALDCRLGQQHDLGRTPTVQASEPSDWIAIRGE
jgi:hypothetical protein